MQIFYLVSTELRTAYPPRYCVVKLRLKTKLRDDIALVKVSPEIPKEIYHSSTDISELLLVSRLEKQSLFDIREWPVYVYICIPNKNISPGQELQDDDFSITDWGAVYSREEEALRSLKG